MRSAFGSARVPSSFTMRPFTRTRPASMIASAARREATPARARIFCNRSPFPAGAVSLSLRMRRVEKPWGHETIWAETDRYVGKVLHINAGQKLSRQYHERKDETFYVQSGVMQLEIGDGPTLKTLTMNPGESFHCTPHTIHRMIATTTDVDVIEVSTPELDDVVRLE